MGALRWVFHVFVKTKKTIQAVRSSCPIKNFESHLYNFARHTAIARAVVCALRVVLSVEGVLVCVLYCMYLIVVCVCAHLTVSSTPVSSTPYLYPFPYPHLYP